MSAWAGDAEPAILADVRSRERTSSSREGDERQRADRGDRTDQVDQGTVGGDRFDEGEQGDP